MRLPPFKKDRLLGEHQRNAHCITFKMPGVSTCATFFATSLAWLTFIESSLQNFTCHQRNSYSGQSFSPFGAAFSTGGRCGDGEQRWFTRTIHFGVGQVPVFLWRSQKRERVFRRLSPTGLCNSKLGHFACQTPPESVHRLLFQPSKNVTGKVTLCC
jgi:hypothetical protein